MRKRLLASLLSLVMVMSLVPVSALAAEGEEPGGDPAPVCTCETLCTEGAVDENCPVCAGDFALCTYKEPPADGDENDYYETNDVTDPADPSVEEQLAALVAALPDPADIDPMDEVQMEAVYNQIAGIYAFAEENGLGNSEDGLHDAALDAVVNAVITALNPVEMLASGQVISTDTTWDTATTLTEDLTVDSNVTLTISAKVTISGNVTISGGGTIKRGNSYKDALIVVGDGASLTLENITVDGGAVWSTDTSDSNHSSVLSRGTSNTGISADAAAVEVYGSLTLGSGAVVQNNERKTSANANDWISYTDDKVSDKYYVVGGGISVVGGSLNMQSGSTVQNNAIFAQTAPDSSAQYPDALGGGIGFYNAKSFNLNGGEIKGNQAITSDNASNGHRAARALGGGIGAVSRSNSSGFTATMSGGTISYNMGSSVGGAYYTTDGTDTSQLNVILNGTGIEHNYSAASAGGISVYAGIFELKSGTVSYNTCAGSGGGINIGGGTTLTMSGGKVNNNVAGKESSSTGIGGGGIVATSSSLTVTGGEISNNTVEASDSRGGGIYLNNKNALTLSNAKISQNQAAYGGGIYINTNSSMQMTSGEISENGQSKSLDGGGIYLNGTNLTISGGTISKNTANAGSNGSSNGFGGGIYARAGTVTISSGNISENSARYGGGIIIQSGVNLYLSGGMIEKNKASNGGGGIYLSSTGEMSVSQNCVISSNEAASGGGIYLNSGSLTMEAGNIRNNISSSYGGGIHVIGTLTLRGGEISENSAGTSGGGIFVGTNGTLKVDGNPIVTGNTKGRDSSATANNIYLPSGKYITLDGELTTGASIGVSTAATPSSETEIQITTAENTTTYYSDAAQYFLYDGDGVAVADSDNKYIKIVYGKTITFNANTGSEDSETSVQQVVYNISTELDANTFVREGYTFQNWSTQQNGGETTYADKASITATENLTLYAQWTLNDPSSVEVTADTTSIVKDSGTATLTATAEHDLAGVTYEYQWYTGAPNSGSAISGATSQTYTATGLTASTTYYCKVTAVNGSDKSVAVASNSATITVAGAEGNVTITGSKTTATYGDEPFTFTYTANGTATVTSSDTSVATVSDSNGTVTVTIVGAGTTEISVGFAGDTNYSAASEKFTLTVNKAALTVTADSKTIYVGDALPTAYTYTVTGWKGNDAASASTLLSGVSVSCANANANKADNYPITVTGPESIDNYTITYVNGTLTVRTHSGGGGGGSSSSGYAVSVDSTKNGTVTVSPRNASKGTTVTITVKPNSGYELDDLTVTDKNGDAVKLTRKSDTQYTFTMPASRVTVEATFAEIVAELDVSFIDVPANAYYYDAVAWAVENGVTNGTSDTTFSPDVTCTRAQTVTFLWRAAGSPAPRSSVNPFTDVQPGAYYYEAVLWAVENGITKGTSDTTFSPDDTVTRGQTVTFQHRAASSPAASGGTFADVAADAYYAPAVQWAVANGITNGTSSTTFSPDDPCTRGQIVTFLYRDMA